MTVHCKGSTARLSDIQLTHSETTTLIYETLPESFSVNYKRENQDKGVFGVSGNVPDVEK